MKSINYYKILQVDPSAEQEVIEAAYKRLALKYHPDVNKLPDATRRMQEINEAYSVLGNITARKKYDREQVYGVEQKIYQRENTEVERQDAEKKRRTQEEIRKQAELDRQRKEQEKAKRRELAPQLCKSYLDAKHPERLKLMQEVILLGCIAIEVLIDNLCNEATTINNEFLPRETKLQQSAILKDKEMQNDYVFFQIEKLETVARLKLEEKVVAASEIFIQLAKTDVFWDIDRLAKNVIDLDISKKWVLTLIMYYSAQALGIKVRHLVTYLSKGRFNPILQLWEDARLAFVYVIISAKAGDKISQEWIAKLLGEDKDKKFIDIKTAEWEKERINDGYIELVRSRSLTKYVVRF